MAIALGGRNAGEEFGFEAVAERLDGRGVGGLLGAGELGGAAETGDPGDVFGAAASSALLVSAVEVWREGRTFADDEGADTFGTAQLVRAQRKVIDGQGFEVDRKFADGLHGVAVKPPAALLAERRDVGHGEEHARLVVRPHERDDGGVGRDRGFEGGEIEEAVAVHGQAGDAVAVFFEEDRVIEHGGVLDGRGDDVTFGGIGREGCEEGGIVALGGAAGEYDLTGGGAEQCGDVATGFLDHAFQRGAEHITAARIAPAFGEKRAHRFEDLGSKWRCGVVVEVDHRPRFGRVLVSVNVAAGTVTRIRPRGFPGGSRRWRSVWS